jgi:hypothetical protein
VLTGLTGPALALEGHAAATALYLRELQDAVAAMHSLDLDGIAPAIAFDPSWPEERA